MEKDMGEKENNNMVVAAKTTTTIAVAADAAATANNKISTTAAMDGAATATDDQITTVDAADNAAKSSDTKKNRIQVSNTKRPIFFYLNLAKRYIKRHNDVELSGFGMAIPTVVIIAEILKRNGLATATRISTSSVGTNDVATGRKIKKAKIEVELSKAETAGNTDEETK